MANVASTTAFKPIVLLEVVSRDRVEDICWVCREEKSNDNGKIWVAHTNKAQNNSSLVHFVHLKCLRVWLSAHNYCPSDNYPVDSSKLPPF